jgi:hypothetical protein
MLINVLMHATGLLPVTMRLESRMRTRNEQPSGGREAGVALVGDQIVGWRMLAPFPRVIGSVQHWLAGQHAGRDRGPLPGGQGRCTARAGVAPPARRQAAH